jgi:hypothetical protein
MSQGYGVTQNLLLQDNQSSILLERNGKASSGKRTRHINIRYFFITDRVNMKEIEIEWCPTKEMVADFMTKPLQGSHFRRLRDLIMGTTSIKKAKIPRKSTVTVTKRWSSKGQGSRERTNSCEACKPYQCCVGGTVSAPQECVGVYIIS